ncbi:Alpha/beta-Hydrolases superfamily protein [Hirschfeldia incana]|nr:Alpha/beta-Hydrolases superfamily protein [Hirschfeldia incana]
MEQLVNFIIRPPRAEYKPEHDLLEQEFLLKGRWYQRKDLEVKNTRGDVLKCSHYMPLEQRPEDRPLPCVIYCHGNSGCRADASEAAIVLLPSNITIFTLDFSGSGLSGGEYVTLGWNEKDDLKAVVEYLRTDGNVSLIGLWGRSMGAVTSLMYGAEDPSIAAMVLDSPFSDLVDLMMELVDTYKFPLPKFTIKFAIQYMRRAVQKKAKFDITDLNTIKVAKSCFVPVLFGHAIDDDFIRPHHTERIYEAYIGDKNIIKFEGDHNSPRPQFYFDSINIFFHNVLQPPEVVGTRLFDPVDDYFVKGSWSSMQELSSQPSSAQKSSTSDAINEVRMKRPMSRTEVPSNVPSNQSSSETKEKENYEVSSSSSSDMISFDLSNGDPYPPHLSVALDDDQYVEFQVEDLADFPSNADEEERMLTEAVMKSLKDVEVETHQKNKEPSKTDTENTVEKEGNAATSTTEPESAHPETYSASGPTLSNPDSPPSSEDNPTCKTSEYSLPGPVNGIVPGASPKMSQDTGDAIDLSARTKATVTVVGRSSTSGNVLDGLLRRWDLNFFKSR